MKIAGPALALSLLAIVQPAHAASFNCAAAKSKAEKLICSDAKLSDLDGRLAQTYTVRLGGLSGAGAELLKASQRSWLHFANLTCVSRKLSEYSGPASCLHRLYEERIGQLAQVGQHIGPYIFNRIDLYRAKPAKDGDMDGSTTGFYTEHVAYPQIDNPSSGTQIVWNKRNKRALAAKMEDEEDDDLEFTIGIAGNFLISVQWDSSTYEHGAAHGYGSTRADNTILEPSPRAALAADIFGATDHWKKPLQDLFWNALLVQGWKNVPTKGPELRDKGMMNIAVSPDRWFFAQDGLTIGFDSYDGGCYACTPRPVTLRWTDIKPLLATDLISP